MAGGWWLGRRIIGENWLKVGVKFCGFAGKSIWKQVSWCVRKWVRACDEIGMGPQFMNPFIYIFIDLFIDLFIYLSIIIRSK